MRRVKRLWPAWVVGTLTGTAYGAMQTLLVARIGSFTIREQMIIALIPGVIYGVVSGTSTAYQRRRTFSVDGAKLTTAERIQAINMTRGLDHSDDPRLRQAATTIAIRASRIAPVVAFAILWALLITLLVIIPPIRPQEWVLVAVLAAASILIARTWHRNRTAARIYLATTEHRPDPIGLRILDR